MQSIECNHLGTITDHTKYDQEWCCAWCHFRGDNLWLCLHKGCCLAGCSESQQDHSTKHQQEHPSHAVHLNLSSLRAWCYLCEKEVYLSTYTKGEAVEVRDGSSDEDIDMDATNVRPLGLTGLKNIGNTCYMNAALQALSNIQPLTEFFRLCITNVKSDIRPALSLSYQQLMLDLWHPSCPSYVVPSSILHGIGVVHPMFRGFHQQDTQEFLRCFLDQLHEELKEPISAPSVVVEMEDADSGMMSHSDAEYETCDSSEHSDGDSNKYKKNITKQMKDVSNQLAQQNMSVSVENISEADTSGIDIDMCSESVIDSNRASRSPSPLMRKSPTFSRKKTASRGPSPQPQYRSIISDVFDGKILSSVQCLTCETISQTEETFQDLSLPIPTQDHLALLHHGAQKSAALVSCSDFYSSKQGWLSWIWQWFWSFFRGPSVSLHDCLAAFFSRDELKGDNMYSCEKCKKLRNGMKFSKVLSLPEVLCIHFKRFRHELMFNSSKISSYIHFPLTGLDLTSFLHKDCRSSTALYNCNAVICHHGNWGSGHYTTYALNYYNNRWYEFDDQTVTEVSPETVEYAQAYVLFYRKCDEEMSNKRQKVVSLGMLSGEIPLMHFYVSKQWVNKFNYFAEPGPIDNSDFLCCHGGVRPDKFHIIEELYTVLPQGVWEYLHRTFGGGPACNRLRTCSICQEEANRVEARKKHEMESFVRLDKKDASNDAVYALSMRWFRSWEGWVRGKEVLPPGPIDNTHIVTNRGQLKTGSDYAQVSEEVWNFFCGIYGGKPEVLLRGSRQVQQDSPEKTSENVTQVHSLRVRKSRSSSESQAEQPGSPSAGREGLNN